MQKTPDRINDWQAHIDRAEAELEEFDQRDFTAETVIDIYADHGVHLSEGAKKRLRDKDTFERQLIVNRIECFVTALAREKKKKR